MKLWWGGHDLNWFHHTLCTIQLSGVSWNCNRTGLFDDSQVYWMFLGKKQYPNPVKPLFGTRQNLWSSTLVHDFPTFLYLFWVDELFWRRKKNTCFGRASTTPITSQPFCAFFFPQRHSGEKGMIFRGATVERFERHGFAEAELGQDAERRTQLRSYGTEVLQRLGVRKGFGRGMAGWMILGDIMNDDHGVMEDMFIDFSWIWMWLQ